MSDKVILRHNGGGYWWATDCGPAMRACDVVAGNRYSEADNPHRLVPDDSGPWLALVTYRGPNAPPRPEVLPVGTRVRLREHRRRLGIRLGTITAPNRLHGDTGPIQPGYWNVDYDGHGGGLRVHIDDVEVLSLPEPAKAEPFVVLGDSNLGRSGPAWMSDGTFRGLDGDIPPGDDISRKFLASRFVKGGRYKATGEEVKGGWLCVRDYTGPDYREPARAIHGQVVGDPAEAGSATIAQPTDGPPPLGAREQAIVDRLAALGWECGRRFCDAPLTRGSVRVWLRASGPEICGGPKLTRGESAYSGPADARLYHTALGQALDAIEATTPPVEIPGESSGVPDYAHPRAALRARTFVVPTDLDDHLIPDAEPGWGGPR